jgi:hypothetical protein
MVNCILEREESKAIARRSAQYVVSDVCKISNPIQLIFFELMTTQDRCDHKNFISLVVSTARTWRSHTLENFPLLLK